MDREINTWLFDIQKAIGEIEEFLSQGQRIFENYKDVDKPAVWNNLGAKYYTLHFTLRI